MTIQEQLKALEGQEVTGTLDLEGLVQLGATAKLEPLHAGWWTIGAYDPDCPEGFVFHENGVIEIDDKNIILGDSVHLKKL